MNKTYTHTDKLSLMRRRGLIVSVFVFIMMLGLVYRLYYLQIIKQEQFSHMAMINQYQTEYQESKRGIIKDRNGVILADNYPAYHLTSTADEIRRNPNIFREIEEITPLSSKDKSSLKDHLKWLPPSVPVPIKKNLSFDEAVELSLHQKPYYRITGALERVYPFDKYTAHLIGYVAAPSSSEAKQMARELNHVYNHVGTFGLESLYEKTLRGGLGYTLTERDASGRYKKVVQKSPALAGNNLTLTIDIRLQKAAYEALKKFRGALVAIDPNNGEILALASTPSFDPNAFMRRKELEINKIIQNRDKPMFNRAIKGTFPIASTIKPFLGLHALDHGFVKPHQVYRDKGFYQVTPKSRKFKDWLPGGHGNVTLHQALVISCDTFFYELGVKMGIDGINHALLPFGFGQKTMIDLPGESQGIVPNPEWKKARGEHWYTGDTIVTSIGQGALSTTPLQLANAVAMIAAKGVQYKPHLVKEIESQNDSLKKIAPQITHTVTYKDSTWDYITYAMKNVTLYGTGHHFGKTPYTVASKTGTAQMIENSNASTPQNLQDHSLFIAFAPVEKPQIAVAVVIENHRDAPDITKVFLDKYFQLYSEKTK